MKGNQLLIWIVLELILSGIIEVTIQIFEGIIGLGIIAMLYFMIINIHDMFLVKEKERKNE